MLVYIFYDMKIVYGYFIHSYSGKFDQQHFGLSLNKMTLRLFKNNASLYKRNIVIDLSSKYYLFTLFLFLVYGLLILCMIYIWTWFMIRKTNLFTGHNYVNFAVYLCAQ